MEITDFLESILNKEEHAGDLLKKDKTYISLGNGNNNILIEYNGLNSYNFKVLDTGDIKLVEGRIEKIKGKSFIRESTIFNIDGSDKLRTVYYKTYKITSFGLYTQKIFEFSSKTRQIDRENKRQPDSGSSA